MNVEPSFTPDQIAAMRAQFAAGQEAMARLREAVRQFVDPDELAKKLTAMAEAAEHDEPDEDESEWSIERHCAQPRPLHPSEAEAYSRDVIERCGHKVDPNVNDAGTIITEYRFGRVGSGIVEGAIVGVIDTEWLIALLADRFDKTDEEMLGDYVDSLHDYALKVDGAVKAGVARPIVDRTEHGNLRYVNRQVVTLEPGQFDRLRTKDRYRPTGKAAT